MIDNTTTAIIPSRVKIEIIVEQQILQLNLSSFFARKYCTGADSFSLSNLDWLCKISFWLSKSSRTIAKRRSMLMSNRSSNVGSDLIVVCHQLKFNFFSVCSLQPATLPPNSIFSFFQCLFSSVCHSAIQFKFSFFSVSALRRLPLCHQFRIQF